MLRLFVGIALPPEIKLRLQPLCGGVAGARWVDPQNFAKGPTHFFDGAPEHVREKLREDTGATSGSLLMSPRA